MANDQDTFHADLSELLTILGMGDHSRPYSPHEVFQEALGVLRERLSLPAPTPTPPCLGEREAVARTGECLAKTFEGLAEAADKKIWDVPECSDASEQEAFWFGYRDACRDAAKRLRASPVDATLRTENETLRNDLNAAKAEVTKLCYRVDQMHRDWAGEGIEWLRASDIDRLQGAEARAMTAETERDAAIARAEEAEVWKRIAESAGVCMTCAISAPDTFGCTDCLNTGWAQGSPEGFVPETELAQTKAQMTGDRAALKVKAEEQIDYWRKHQAAEKALEDGVSEDGETYTPIGDEAAWQAGYCNGRMSEADWWRSTFKYAFPALTTPEHPHGD